MAISTLVEFEYGLVHLHVQYLKLDSDEGMRTDAQRKDYGDDYNAL